MSQLFDLRKSIDLIDVAIIHLLAERMRIVVKVGQYKKQQNIPALDQARWKEVLSSKMATANKLGLDQNLVQDIYNIIHEHALKTENKS